MSYNATYHRVLMRLNAMRAQHHTPWSVSDLETKSQTSLREKQSTCNLRRSRSDSRLDNYIEYSQHDPRTLIIQAIMKAEKERVARKMNQESMKVHDSTWTDVSCGSNNEGDSVQDRQAKFEALHTTDDAEDQPLRGKDCSSAVDDGMDTLAYDCNSSETSLYGRRIRLPESEASDASPSTTNKLRDLRRRKDVEMLAVAERAVVAMTESEASDASPNTTNELRDLRRRKDVEMLAVAERAVVAMTDSEASDTSPNTTNKLRDVRRRKDVEMLAVAERAVTAMLDEVTTMERQQSKRHSGIPDLALRDLTKDQDWRRNEEFVRGRLIELETRLGTAKVAAFGELWEQIKWEKNCNHKGISYLEWTKEKMDMLKDRRLENEKKRREKKEAQDFREENCRQAYKKWCERARSVPKPRPVMPLLAGTKDVLRQPDSFYNPIPWVDILEEEKKKKKEAAVHLAASAKLTSPWGSTSSCRGTPSEGQRSPEYIERSDEAKRKSTYEAVGEYYVDLLRRCQIATNRAYSNRKLKSPTAQAFYRPPVTKVTKSEETSMKGTNDNASTVFDIPVQAYFRRQYKSKPGISGARKSNLKRRNNNIM